MRRPMFGNGHAPRVFLRRLDQASARMTPYLVLLVIGLTLVNLIGLALATQHLSITRRTPGWAPAEAGCSIVPRADARLMSGT